MFQLSHKWPSYYYILPSVLFSVLYNIPRFLELTTETLTSGDGANITDSLVLVSPTELREVLKAFRC